MMHVFIEIIGENLGENHSISDTRRPPSKDGCWKVSDCLGEKTLALRYSIPRFSMQARNIPGHVRHKQRMANEEIMIVINDIR